MLASVEMGVKGREFIIVMTLAINVVKTSCVSLVGVFIKRASRIRLAIPIILSHTPPIWWISSQNLSLCLNENVSPVLLQSRSVAEHK